METVGVSAAVGIQLGLLVMATVFVIYCLCNSVRR